jgi:pseudouridine synthase
MQQSCLLFMALSGLVHSRVHLVHDARWTNHRTFLRSRHAQGKASALPRLVFRYWKPAGVLSTTLPTSDGVNILQHNTTLARQVALTAAGRPVVPIGRLDKASRGLLLLTTDAALCARLLRPGRGVEGSSVDKEYHVVTRRRLADSELASLAAGVEISVPKSGASARAATRACVVERLQAGGWAEALDRGVDILARTAQPDNNSRASRSDESDESGESGESDESRSLRIVLREGMNRQIRKMLGALGHSVDDLFRVSCYAVGLGHDLGPVRPAASPKPRAEPSILHAQVRIGTVRLGTLHEGEADVLSSEEMERLLALTQR